jgi:hypothetical protein
MLVQRFVHIDRDVIPTLREWHQLHGVFLSPCAVKLDKVRDDSALERRLTRCLCWPLQQGHAMTCTPGWTVSARA